MRDARSVHTKVLNRFNFKNHLSQHGISLKRKALTTLQVNVGKKCNQACHHCHVDASPKRTEEMNQETATKIIRLLENSSVVDTVDITGGAPELNPHFRTLVQAAKGLGLHVMDRCNLTILLEEGQETLAEFLADHQVEIIASLPCYLSDNVDQQRGRGVYAKSIKALQILNGLGYGQPQSNLLLNLVYNPLGSSLPPPQSALELEYKEQLRTKFGIEFNHLFTITNMPISRFADQLHRANELEDYMHLLVEAFNPATVENLMCRNLISVDWEGNLYDCDFNQMLGMQVPGRQTVWSMESIDQYQEDLIVTGAHCFGCVAGAGSSCGGVLAG